MMRFLAFSGGRPSVGPPRPPRPGESVWLDLTAPTPEELDAFRRIHPVHPVVFARVRTLPDRPRLGVYEDHILLSFLAAEPDGDRFRPGEPRRGTLPPPERPERAFNPVGMILARDFLATVAASPIPAVDAVWRTYAEEGAEGSADLALYHVLDRLVGAYEQLVEGLVDRAESINLHLADAGGRDLLAEVAAVRREALGLRRVVDPTADRLGLLDGEDFPFVSPGHRAYFQDLHERVRGLAEEIESTRAMLSEAVEAYASVQSHRIDRIMKVLTVLGTVFLPATLIASIYGMNFAIPEYRWSFGYPYALGLMAAVSVGLLLYGRHRGWLD
jgi:magnesium transporter